MNDKPIVGITAAQQAAATAQQVANAAEAAQTALTAVPGDVPQKNLLLKVLGGTVVVAGAVVAFATMGIVPAIVVVVPSVTGYIAGLYQASPAAVAKFGSAAK
jgi:hypothetical protein